MRCDTCKGKGRFDGPPPDWDTWTHDPYLCLACGGVGLKIPIKRYVMDPFLSWEARYRQLNAHYNEETVWLIEEIHRLHKQVDDLTAKTPPGAADMRTWTTPKVKE